MSKVRNNYAIYKEHGVDLFYDWEKYLYEAALEDPKEKEELIRLFEEEQNSGDKVTLASILARLGDDRVIPFLIEACEKLVYGCSGAAFALLRLNYPDTKRLFIRLLDDPELPRHWIHDSLYRLNTPLTNEILDELIQRDEGIKLSIEAMKKDPETYAREIDDWDW